MRWYLILLRASASVCANFLSILQEKTYFFYFTHPLLQNTYISSSILHIYLIKYSFFLHFFIISFPLVFSVQTHHLVFFVHTHTQPATLQQNLAANSPIFHNNNDSPIFHNNKIQPLIHRSSTTTITTTTTQSQSQQLWPTRPPCPINSPSSSPFPNGLLDQRGWSAFPTHSPPKLADRTQSVVREISAEEEGEADRLCKWERVEMRERESCDESQREKKLIK